MTAIGRPIRIQLNCMTTCTTAASQTRQFPADHESEAAPASSAGTAVASTFRWKRYIACSLCVQPEVPAMTMETYHWERKHESDPPVSLSIIRTLPEGD